MSRLPLDDIVKIVVNLGLRATVRRGFNLPLLVGKSDVIPPEERVRLYSSTEAMIEDGFTETDPEYIGARLVFSQEQSPPRVAIGRHNIVDGLGEFEVITSESVETAGEYLVAWEHDASVGNSFVYKAVSSFSTPPAFGEVLDTTWLGIVSGQVITPVSGMNGIFVAEINAAREVVNVGAAMLGGDSVSLGLPLAETVTDAVRACRNANSEWYIVIYLGATTDDIMSIAQYVEAAKPDTVQFFTTDDPLTLTLTTSADGIFARLRAKSFRRSLGQYSVTPYAVCGIAGYAMGANTRLSRSAFTLMHKPVVGIAPDSLTPTQVDNLKRQNGNYYVSRGFGDDYSMFEQGTMSDGVFFDEVLNLDMLVNDMQRAVLDLFRNRPKVPQEEAGMNDIKMSLTPSLVRVRMIGFVAPGRWDGADIYTEPDFAPLRRGDMLDKGYLVFSEPVDLQSQADREQRIAPPIYVPIKLAGAIHRVVIQIDVNR